MWRKLTAKTIYVLTLVFHFILKWFLSEDFLIKWKPIHLCWWHEKHGFPIPKYFIGTTATAPSVTTNAATSVGSTSATGNGNVTSDGGATVSERGFVHSVTSVNNNPLIGGTGVTKTIVSGTTGSYSGTLASLAASTGYSYKAYAINSKGTGYGSVQTFTTASFTQVRFRFYADGTESGSTPKANEDTHLSGATAVATANTTWTGALRILIQTNAVGGLSTDDWKLYYSKNAGAYTAVTGSSSNVKAYNGTLTDGEATTNRSTNGLTDGSGSFVAGKVDEADGEIVDVQITANNFTELLWSIQLVSADLASGDTLDFRVYRNGAAIQTYTITPRITVSKGTAPTVALGTNVVDTATITDTTPSFEFTGTDTESDDVRYQIQVDLLNSFSSQAAWSETQPAGAANKNWRSCSIAYDGTTVKAIAGVYGGRLYVYGGSSWLEVQPAGDVNKNWSSCSIAYDGTTVKAMAGIYGSRLYMYDGSSWSEVQPAGDVDKNWYNCSIAYDGTTVKAIAGVYGGRLYMYDGSSWSEVQPAGDADKNWASSSIAYDGTTVRAIAGVDGGRLYTYGGSSWSEVQPAGDADKTWLSCSIAYDGTTVKAIAGASGSRLYMYGGSSWSEVQPAGAADKFWRSCSIAYDGTTVKAMAGAYGGRLYVYDGSSWSEVQPAGDADKDWYNCSIAYDGTNIRAIAGVYNSRLYMYGDGGGSSLIDHTSNVETAAFVRTADSDPFTSAQEVTYTVPGDDALSADTYYWRVRGLDPSGSNSYGAWSTTRSFTLTADVTPTNLLLNVITNA
jgi:hypothetical protein